MSSLERKEVSEKGLFTGTGAIWLRPVVTQGLKFRLLMLSPHVVTHSHTVTLGQDGKKGFTIQVIYLLLWNFQIYIKVERIVQ